MTNEKSKIIEHRFLILDVEKRNKNHRFYTSNIVDKWVEDERIENGQGIDIEYALDDDSDGEDGCLKNEFLTEHLSCGIVTKIEKEGIKYYGIVKFKKNDLTKDIYSGEIKLDDITIVPKGKGSIKNQEVQPDYELFGFNLIKVSDSAFVFDDEEKVEIEKE